MNNNRYSVKRIGYRHAKPDDITVSDYLKAAALTLQHSLTSSAYAQVIELEMMFND
jgi:hypothetical protein